MSSASDFDREVASQINSVVLEDRIRKPLLAFARNFTELHYKKSQEIRGGLLSG